MPVPDEIRGRAEDLGITVSPQQWAQLADYLAFLLETNTRFNLTAIREEALAWERHILDSLTLVPILEPLAPASLADLGSGGGLPGIPLAIMLPTTAITLIEATGKKAAFLGQCAERLGLANIEVVADRAELYGRRGQPGRERFDVVTARAVGRLLVLAELACPLLRPGGVLCAIKGERATEEIDETQPALAALRLELLETIETPTGTLVLLEKSGPTPSRFPRGVGEAQHKPLTG